MARENLQPKLASQHHLITTILHSFGTKLHHVSFSYQHLEYTLNHGIYITYLCEHPFLLFPPSPGVSQSSGKWFTIQVWHRFLVNKYCWLWFSEVPFGGCQNTSLTPGTTLICDSTFLHKKKTKKKHGELIWKWNLKEAT